MKRAIARMINKKLKEEKLFSNAQINTIDGVNSVRTHS